MMRRPPRSTLFPYTTLFRSVHIYGHMRYYDVAAGDIVHAGDQIAKVGNEGFSTGPHLHYEIHRGDMNGRDRKSTRLNSSHANISYAVFCLKKKTIPSCSRQP